MPFVRRRQLWVHAVLAWFLLFVGVSVASPWLRAPDLQDVCSSRPVVGWGARAQAAESTGAWEGGRVHGLDCPACLPGLAPMPAGPSLAWAGPLPQAEPGPPLRRPPALRTRAALPARGPPGLA